MPASYKPHTRGDSLKQESRSQTLDGTKSGILTPVSKLLEHKGNAVYSIGPGNTIHDAVKELKDKRIGALVVLDDEGALVGVLSERDIVRTMAEMPGKTLPSFVRDSMTAEVLTCTPDETVINVLKLMTENRIRHLPVLDGDNLCGMITIGDVVQHRVTELEHEAVYLKQLIVG